MDWLHEVGPIALASIATVIATWGMTHGWNHALNAWLLFFAGFVALASLTVRACAAAHRAWERFTSA